MPEKVFCKDFNSIKSNPFTVKLPKFLHDSNVPIIDFTFIFFVENIITEVNSSIPLNI